MKGDFTVVDCRTLTGEGKENCRLLTLNCSTEFLEYLATKLKSDRYTLYHSTVFINGGKRKDSVSDYSGPDLTPEITGKLLKANTNQIQLYSAHRLGIRKAMERSQRSVSYTHLTLPTTPYV